MRKTDLERDELINTLYFKHKLTVSEISKKVNLSVSQVSRVLSKSPLYKQEKANRKEENKKTHIEKTKEYIRKKRMEERDILKRIHNQDVLELSLTKF